MRALCVSLFLIVCTAACTSAPELEGFDAHAWRNDPEGCKGDRVAQVNALLSQKEKLIGKGQQEIIALLGSPSEHELYQRTRKFFYYPVDPIATCPEADSGPDNPRVLSLRFNALDMCNEVIIRY